MRLNCRSFALSAAGEPLRTPLCLCPCRTALFTPPPDTKPDLTAFPRALCIRRVESRHGEQHSRSMRTSARRSRGAEGATLFWVDRNLVVALWIDLALPHALLRPLCACLWSPAHIFRLYPHVCCEMCTLMCVVLCDSRVVRIARLLSCV